MNYEIIFYETMDGKCPISDFLDSLDIKMRAKITGLMEVLEEKAISLREPYSKHLDDGIFELRCKLGNNITRSLYFFYDGKKIIFTNGFIKKTDKVPPSQISLAKKYRTDYIKQQEDNQ